MAYIDRFFSREYLINNNDIIKKYKFNMKEIWTPKIIYIKNTTFRKSINKQDKVKKKTGG